MHEPRAGVVCYEAQRHGAARGDVDSVAPHGIGVVARRGGIGRHGLVIRRTADDPRDMRMEVANSTI